MMLRYYTFLFITSLIFSQDTLHVFGLKSNTKIGDFDDFLAEGIRDIYQRKFKSKLILDIQETERFVDVFNRLDAQKDKDYSLSLSAISITKERSKKYDFSIPYLPTFQVLARLKSDEQGTRLDLKQEILAYVENSIHEAFAKKLQKKYKGLRLRPYGRINEMIQALERKEVSLMLHENIVVWVDKRLQVLAKLDELVPVKGVGGYALMYQKGSVLKKKLDPLIDYYLKSPAFLKNCEKLFGKEVANYIRSEFLYKGK